MQSHGQTSAWVTPSSFSTTKMKDDGYFSGSGKRIYITMTSVWRCALCPRRIQITQWSGARACNLLPKIEFRFGWLLWREWDCVLLEQIVSTRESGSIRQLSLQSKFLPSFREQYSPPNPESASIGRNLGWRNFGEDDETSESTDSID